MPPKKKKAKKKAKKKQAPKKTSTKIKKEAQQYRGAGLLAKDAATGRGFHAPMGVLGEGRIREHDVPSAAASRSKDAMDWTGRARASGVRLGQAVSSAGSARPLTRLEREGPLLNLGTPKKKKKKKAKKRPTNKRKFRFGRV